MKVSTGLWLSKLDLSFIYVLQVFNSAPHIHAMLIIYPRVRFFRKFGCIEPDIACAARVAKRLLTIEPDYAEITAPSQEGAVSSIAIRPKSDTAFLAPDDKNILTATLLLQPRKGEMS